VTAQAVVDAGFPDALPASDRERWNALTANQRARAARRLGAIVAWHAGDVSLDEAVKRSGLSRSRFYGVAADWRATPSLESLGAQVGSGASARSQVDGDAVNALQAVVAKVVRMNGDASVSELVRLMVAASGLPGERPLGVVRMRTIVETELRRRRSRAAAGNHVRIDITGINLPREGGGAHVMFACLDVGTGAILGAVIGETAQALDGYKRLAGDSLARIAGPLADLPWTKRLENMEIVAGVPKSETDELYLRMEEAGLASVVQLATKFGKYFKAAVGASLGRIEITPGRTEGGDALAVNNDMRPWSRQEVSALLADEVEAHNAAILKARAGEAADGGAPDGLIDVLRFLAAA